MCKRQTAVSHSNAESEVLSLDAGVRMDGSPALQFRECLLETFSTKPAKGNSEPHKRETVIPCHSHVDICVFETIGHVPPNSSHSAQLYPFEDNAVVIQMINKGRSPNIKVRLNNAQSRSGLVV